jgi:hypothetical protein
MNPNPYPQGRWTQFAAAIASKKSRNRLLVKPLAAAEPEAERAGSSGSELFAPDELDLQPQVRRAWLVA